jgi:hypothetical protein
MPRSPRPATLTSEIDRPVRRPLESNSLVAHMIRSVSRFILVLIAAAAIAISAGGFSWDGTPDNSGSGTPETAVVDGPSVDSSGSAIFDGFSWDDGIATTAPVAG